MMKDEVLKEDQIRQKRYFQIKFNVSDTKLQMDYTNVSDTKLQMDVL